MPRGRTRRLLVSRITGAAGARSSARRPDELIVEEPMSIQLDGARVATTMRTPGHDYELAAGFCFTDGLLDGHQITGVRYCADGSAVDSEFNVVTVETGGVAPTPTPRLGNVSSSCGWCGSDQLDELCARLDPLSPPESVDLDRLASIPEQAAEQQSLFGLTGAVHAAAAFDADGHIVVGREDVGRHNAVDKVVGSLLLAAPASPAPGAGLGLFVSGRASIEMVQKAWAAGFGSLVAVSAPTALAVDAARRANLVLAGFVRGHEFNVYSPERLD
ncbi:MAG: formate dehydrogenase accessory sulfurtransferase FdhD [Actinomycetota bacterium]